MRAVLRVEPDVIGAAPRGAATTLLDQITFYGLFGLLGFAPLAFGAVQPWAIFVLESAAAVLFIVWLVAQAKLGEMRILEACGGIQCVDLVFPVHLSRPEIAFHDRHQFNVVIVKIELAVHVAVVQAKQCLRAFDIAQACHLVPSCGRIAEIRRDTVAIA